MRCRCAQKTAFFYHLIVKEKFSNSHHCLDLRTGKMSKYILLNKLGFLNWLLGPQTLYSIIWGRVLLPTHQNFVQDYIYIYIYIWRYCSFHYNIWILEIYCALVSPVLQCGRPIQRHSWTFPSCPHKDACHNYACHGSNLSVRIVCTYKLLQYHPFWDLSGIRHPFPLNT